jgi:two-component system response regulator
MMESNQPVELLLVEDNPKDIELTLYTLRENKLGNSIVVAKDGEEALDFLFCRNSHAGRSVKNHPRVVLLDLKLPKVDGIEVLKELKSNPKTKSIPVVVLTSSREEKDLIATYQLGVNSYIVKPIDFDQFVQAVKDIGLYWLLHNTVAKSEK